MNIIKNPKFEFTDEEIKALNTTTDIIRIIRNEMVNIDNAIIEGYLWSDIDNCFNVLVDIYNASCYTKTLELEDFEDGE